MVKKGMLLLALFSIVAMMIVLRGLGQLEIENLRLQIAETGALAPVVYMLVYASATALILPSTVLNLAGGALFGVVWGIVWTSLAAVGSAVFTFWATRLWVRTWVQRHLNQNYQALDREISEGGTLYLFAVRLLPIIPYGIINYSSGLTSVSFRDYFVGTTFGTVLGLFPFVMLGSSGVEAISTGQAWRIIFPMSIIALLILSTAWYKRLKRLADRR